MMYHVQQTIMKKWQNSSIKQKNIKKISVTAKLIHTMRVELKVKINEIK